MYLQAAAQKILSLKKTLKYIWKHKSIYLMVVFPLTFFIVFRYVPMYGIQLAFKDYVLSGISKSPWNNFSHFRVMFSEAEFFRAVRNTFIISGMRILISFPFPIFLALMINEIYSMKYKRVLQTIYTFPHFLSWVLLSGIFLNLLGSGGMIRKFAMVFSPDMASNWDLLYNHGFSC